MEEASGVNMFNASNAQSETPLFTLGALPIPKASRGWDRAPRSPRRSHRKGAKVWKRPAAITSADTDALASAQLLGDLAAAVSSNGHTAKRQRVQSIPAVSTAVVPAVRQKQTTYTATVTDGNERPKRKLTKRRKSTKSPVKKIAEESWLSPAKGGARRRSSIKPVSVRKSLDASVLMDISATEGVSGIMQKAEESAEETSFLKNIDLAGSTMFDREPAETEDGNDDSALQLDGQDDLSAIDSDSSGEDSEEDDGGSEDIDESELGEQSETMDDEVNSTARLLDAGHTGVVDVSLEDVAGSEDELDEATLTNGDLDLQANVTEMLATPPKHEQEPDADELSATPSPATQESSSVSLDAIQTSIEVPSPIPSLAREGTGSTVEFDEPFFPPKVMEVTKDHVFRSPEATLHVANAVESSVQASHPHSPQSAGPAVALDMDLSTPLKMSDEEENEDEAQVDRRNQEDDEDEKDASPSPSDSRDPTLLPPVTHLALTEEDISDEESEDELFTGEPTMNNVVLSPTKMALASTASPSPKRIRPAPRLSDDSTYLNDFLSRVKAQAAARSQAAPSPVKTLTPKTSSPRKALEPLDANSPSPSPVKRRSSKDNGSPIALPKTPTARLLMESAMDPDTPDELGTAADDEAPRRSGRSRLPAPAKLPLAAPNAINLRRLDREPPLIQRNDSQKLAMATRNNTRRNKGNSAMPRAVIERLENKELSPIKQRALGKNKKGQNVDWDNQLVYYLEEQETEKEKPRTKRKAKVLEQDENPEENKENSEPTASATPQPKKKSVRITRTPRPAKVEVPAVEESSEVNKPVEVETKIPVSRLRQPRAGTSTNRGTPVARKVSAVESTQSTQPAARRRTTRRV